MTKFVTFLKKKQYFTNSLGDVKTRPGANTVSDQNIIVAEVQT